MLELAKRAFAPSPVPFELVHVDTGHNFPEVIEFRDMISADPRVNLHVALVQDWIDSGAIQERPDGTRNPLQTVPLVETIQNRGYDAVLGGARRDEGRAKERVFSVRDSFGGWNPRRQRPELWAYTTGGTKSAKTFVYSQSLTGLKLMCGTTSVTAMWKSPLSTTPTSAKFSSAMACGLLPANGVAKEGEELVTKTVRYRTVGDMSCTAVLSEATTIEDVIDEIRTSTTTERGATRADDKLSESSMEDRKKEGYF